MNEKSSNEAAAGDGSSKKSALREEQRDDPRTGEEVSQGKEKVFLIAGHGTVSWFTQVSAINEDEADNKFCRLVHEGKAGFDTGRNWEIDMLEEVKS